MDKRLNGRTSACNYQQVGFLQKRNPMRGAANCCTFESRLLNLQVSSILNVEKLDNDIKLNN